MKQNAYAIFDSKTGLYTKPQFFHNHPAALRAISVETNDPQSTLNQHAEDYTLFFLGTYDDENAQFEQEIPFAVAKCWELKEQESPSIPLPNAHVPPEYTTELPNPSTPKFDR